MMPIPYDMANRLGPYRDHEAEQPDDEYDHSWDGVGFVCRKTGKVVTQVMTNHDRPGCFNSCQYCDPDNFKTVAQSLHEINERRKREAEKR